MFKHIFNFLTQSGKGAARTTAKTASVIGAGAATDEIVLDGFIRKTAGSAYNAFNAVAGKIGMGPAIAATIATIGIAGYLASKVVGAGLDVAGKGLGMALTIGAVALGAYGLSQTEMGQKAVQTATNFLGLSAPGVP